MWNVLKCGMCTLFIEQKSTVANKYVETCGVLTTVVARSGRMNLEVGEVNLEVGEVDMEVETLVQPSGDVLTSIAGLR